LAGEARHGVVGYGGAWRGTAWLAWQCGAMRGQVWQGGAGMAGIGQARLGMAWRGRRGKVRRGKVRFGMAGPAWRGEARLGTAGCGRHGVARFGSARHGGAGMESTPLSRVEESGARKENDLLGLFAEVACGLANHAYAKRSKGPVELLR